MNKAKIFIVAALAVMLLAGCKKDKVTLNLSDSDVTGTWKKDGTIQQRVSRRTFQATTMSGASAATSCAT